MAKKEKVLYYLTHNSCVDVIKTKGLIADVIGIPLYDSTEAMEKTLKRDFGEKWYKNADDIIELDVTLPEGFPLEKVGEGKFIAKNDIPTKYIQI